MHKLKIYNTKKFFGHNLHNIYFITDVQETDLSYVFEITLMVDGGIPGGVYTLELSRVYDGTDMYALRNAKGVRPVHKSIIADKDSFIQFMVGCILI